MKNLILVADDDHNNLEVILEFLADKPQEVLYAPNGKVACEIAREELPDLIIMDWEMPVMNGIDSIKQLQADEETREIPIIVATGVMTSSENLQLALGAGAVDFLRKPFNPIEFNARVEATLRLAASHQEIKRLMKESLEQKERELSTAAMFDHQKNHILTDLSERLDRLNKIIHGVAGEELNVIQKEIRSYLNLDKSWNNFKIHFENVHPGFFEKLNAEFGELSNNEVRMCAYLRIGLGNHEIANLTNIESSSVRKSLTRLKKKLGLTADDGLREYIVNF